MSQARCILGRMDSHGDVEVVRGLRLRYLLTTVLTERGPSSVTELVRAVEGEGFVFAGRGTKVVSDALRWEIAHGRVVKLGRGRYGFGSMPPSTRKRIRRRVRQMRERV